MSLAIDTRVRVLTVPDAMEALRCSKGFLYGQIAKGNLKPTKLGRKTVFRHEDVEAFLDAAGRR